VLHYQPYIDLRDMTLVARGARAVAASRPRPAAAGEFIELAEECG